MLSVSHSVVSDFWRPQGLEPTWLFCPGDSPGKNTRVGGHSFLQIFSTQGSNPGLLHCRRIFVLSETPGKPPWLDSAPPKWLHEIVPLLSMIVPYSNTNSILIFPSSMFPVLRYHLFYEIKGFFFNAFSWQNKVVSTWSDSPKNPYSFTENEIKIHI